MPSYKEEHILIVAPGSKTTLAQLGLPESFGPASIRVPTRVFLDKDGKYNPNKIRAKRVKVKRPITANGYAFESASRAATADVTIAPAPPLPLPNTATMAADAATTSGTTTENDQIMGGTAEEALTNAATQANVTIGQPTAPTAEAALSVPGELEEEITQYEEDIDDEEGAIRPIQQGRVVDHRALEALLQHIDNLVSPPMHTPVLIVNDPAWTHKDKEDVAQFYFETLQRPAVSFIASPLAVCGGFGALDACVIDIGLDKTTVSSVLGFNMIDDSTKFLDSCGGQKVNESLARARAKALASERISGPEFTESMAEQLKKQPYICEILQPDIPLPTETAIQAPPTANPAAVASTGVEPEKAATGAPTAGGSGLPRGPGAGTQTGADAEDDANEGVLDVASIVASGKASEILAKREQERADKPKPGQKKGGAQEPPRPVRLTNVQKARVMFKYTERVRASDLQAPKSGEVSAGSAANGAENGVSANGEDDFENYVYANREIEVGVERFSGCDMETFLIPLTTAIVDSINGAPADKRQDLWNNLAIVGNGSKVKGFKERIVTHLTQTCVISPNNNTMFTSELPSQFSTPVATGANTPQPGFGGSHHGASTPTPGAGGSSAVNPLLLAATTASQIQNQGGPGGQVVPPSQPYQSSLQPSTPGQQQHHSSQAQGQQLSLPHLPMHTPTAIKTLAPKDYFPEWKDHGFEEAGFLGACVLARVNFMQDASQPASYMTRVQYNEEGPTGLHHYTLG